MIGYLLQKNLVNSIAMKAIEDILLLSMFIHSKMCNSRRVNEIVKPKGSNIGVRMCF